MRFLIFVCLIGRLYSCLDNMTLEEKIGQLLVVHFQGEEPNEDARILIQETYVGGIIYYQWANGLHSPKQVRDLSDGLQRLAVHNRCPIPLLISIDQEGGRVARLRSGFTAFPSNEAVGQTGDPRFAEGCAYGMGSEMRAVGVNVNFAPVVDVNCNPKNPVIGDRSFGSSSEQVARFGKCALDGYARAGVIATLKHFPGHGDTVLDSHDCLPVIDKSKEELMRVELYPYRQLLQHADMVMTAHLLVPALDTQFCATYSKRILQDLLREELGYRGVIISDSLVMKGALVQASTLENAALLALHAGCDLLLLGGRHLVKDEEHLECSVNDVQRVIRFLVDAVKKGILSEERIDISVQRVLDLKRKYLLSHLD
jgi:beta-N-acetylhexosaminidase